METWKSICKSLERHAKTLDSTMCKFSSLQNQWIKTRQYMCVINDPLGQIHSPSSSDHYSHLKLVLFSEILKSFSDGQPVWT